MTVRTYSSSPAGICTQARSAAESTFDCATSRCNASRTFMTPTARASPWFSLLSTLRPSVSQDRNSGTVNCSSASERSEKLTVLPSTVSSLTSESRLPRIVAVWPTSSWLTLRIWILSLLSLLSLLLLSLGSAGESQAAIWSTEKRASAVFAQRAFFMMSTIDGDIAFSYIKLPDADGTTKVVCVVVEQGSLRAPEGESCMRWPSSQWPRQSWERS